MGDALLVRKGGGKPEGLYVWEKYAYTPPIYETITVSAPDLKFSMYMGSGTTAIQLCCSYDTIDSSITQKFIAGFLDGYSFVDGNSVQRTFSYTDEGILMMNDVEVTVTIGDGWVILKNFGSIVLPSTKSVTATYPESTKEAKNVTTAAIRTLECFTVNDDSDKYPDNGVHTDGYYYKLLAQVTSANAMSLSANALEAVQADYRYKIASEVSQS